MAAQSVAVLSFQSRSRDTADVFLAEGLADDIASRLGQLNRLTVRSREAVRRLRNADSMSVEQLGQSLNAAYILSGSVRPAGHQLHFVIELTRSSTSGTAWSGTFDKTRDQLLELQSAVAEGVARAILGSLARADRKTLVASASSDRAFAHLARGTAFLSRRLPPLAIAEFRQAVEIDPKSPIALARLSQAYSMCVWFSCRSGPALDSMGVLAIAAARRVLAMDSTSADSWLADGLTKSMVAADPPRAIISLRRAIALDPQNPEVTHQLGVALSNFGELEEGTRLYRAALAIDPGRGVTYNTLGRNEWARGNYSAAIALLDTALSLGANAPGSAAAWEQWRFIIASGDTNRIKGAWQRLRPLYGGVDTSDAAFRRRTLLEQGVVALARGDTALANSFADSLRASPYVENAVFLAQLGRLSDAAGIVAASPATFNRWIHLRSPAYDLLRRIPEFVAFVERARRAATTSP